MQSDLDDFNPALLQFRHYLESNGFRESTITMYVDRVKRYLEYAGTNKPSQTDFDIFRDTLHSKKLARNTINNYCISIKAYHKMLGECISFPFLKINNSIPYYFSQDDILNIFSVINNFKHYTMLNVLFYCCLRASELCALNDEDVDFNALTIRVREGKGNKEGICFLNEQTAGILKRYLSIRPPFEIDKQHPLFFTDYGKRWDRRDLYRMFYTYKDKAGVKMKGGLHVFSRHSTASLMIANGCDISIVQKLLRHSDIRTTMRYTHLNDRLQRESHQQFLRL